MTTQRLHAVEFEERLRFAIVALVEDAHLSFEQALRLNVDDVRGKDEHTTLVVNRHWEGNRTVTTPLYRSGEAVQLWLSTRPQSSSERLFVDQEGYPLDQIPGVPTVDELVAEAKHQRLPAGEGGFNGRLAVLESCVRASLTMLLQTGQYRDTPDSFSVAARVLAAVLAQLEDATFLVRA